MSSEPQVPRVIRTRARRLDCPPGRCLLIVSVAEQRLTVWRARAGGWSHRCLGSCRISTSRFGVGARRDSFRTPLGLHRIARKLGGGWPPGTVWRGRKPVGCTWQGQPDAPIAHRIWWLEGLEPGRNRGGDVDSFARFIYVHGVGDETTLGRPASRGCIHLAAKDLLILHEILPVGTLVWIGAGPLVRPEETGPFVPSGPPRPFGRGVL